MGVMPTATGSGQTTSIDLAPDTRKHVIGALNQTLADTLDLYSQVKFAHWNVKGPQFYSLHLLFDEIAGEIIDFADTVAERVTALGGQAMGTVRQSANASALDELPVKLSSGEDYLKALVARLSEYGAAVRSNIDQTAEWGDAGTADLYTEISRDIDKRLWFLEAHLLG